MSKKKLVINTFEKYLEINCKNSGVSLTKANEYAQKGKEFLAAIMQGKEDQCPSTSKSDNVAFLHWHLIKESFNQNRPFSKGMFNLEGKDDEATKRLYNYLKGDARSHRRSLTGQLLQGLTRSSNENFDKSYSRPSTHYNDHFANQDERSFGIDKTEVPLAWKFRTHTFGLVKNGDNSLSVFIKPETRSMDANRTGESIKHGGNLIKKTIRPEKIEGMKHTFREDSIPKDIKDFVKNNLGDKYLTRKVDKEIDSCKSIPALKKLINSIEPTLNLNEYLLDHYGTTNQVGSEQRFNVADDGELTAMAKFVDSEANVLSDSDTSSDEAESGISRDESDSGISSDESIGEYEGDGDHNSIPPLDSDFEEESYSLNSGGLSPLPSSSPVSLTALPATDKARDIKDYFKSKMEEMRQSEVKAPQSDNKELDEVESAPENKR